MIPDPGSRDELAELEARLAAWTPSLPGGRDATLYQAGRRSARADARLRTPLIASAFLTLATCVALTRERNRCNSLEAELAARPLPGPSVPIVAMPPGPPVSPLDPSSYLALSRRVLATALDEPRPPAGAPRSPAPPAPTSSPLTPLQGRSFDPMAG